MLFSAAAGCGPSPPGATPNPSAAASVRVSAGSPDGRPLLARDAALALAAGAGPLEIVGADLLSEGDRVGGFVHVSKEGCALVVARASTSVADLDLFAYDDEGTPVATDERPGPEAAFVVCPPHPDRVYVMARAMSGTGLVAVGVWPVAASVADRVASAVGARGRSGEGSGRLDAWPGLENKLREHRSAIGGSFADVRRAALPVSPRAWTRISMSLDPRECADVLATPEDEIDSIDVVVEDKRGRVVARAAEKNRDRSAVICAGEATDISIAIRSRTSEGLVAVVLGRAAKGGAAEIDRATWVAHTIASADLASARADLGKALDGRAYARPSSAATASAKVGQRTSVPIDVPAGCARIDMIAGKPLGSSLVELWDDQGKLLFGANAGAGVPLFACGKGGALRVDVEALDTGGPFAVEARKERLAPAALVAHPLAASRLLGRLAAASDAADASWANGATVASLDTAQIHTASFSVPARSCSEIIVALGPGAEGLDLRIVDASTGEGLLRRGRWVTSDRVCAAASAVSAKVEVRVGRGKTDGLVLVRNQ